MKNGFYHHGFQESIVKFYRKVKLFKCYIDNIVRNNLAYYGIGHNVKNLLNIQISSTIFSNSTRNYIHIEE